MVLSPTKLLYECDGTRRIGFSRECILDEVEGVFLHLAKMKGYTNIEYSLRQTATLEKGDEGLVFIKRGVDIIEGKIEFAPALVYNIESKIVGWCGFRSIAVRHNHDRNERNEFRNGSEEILKVIRAEATATILQKLDEVSKTILEYFQQITKPEEVRI